MTTQDKDATKPSGDFSREDFHRIEFHRHAMALFPDAGDRRPGIAIVVDGGKTGVRQRACSCSVYAKRTCQHLQELSRLANAFTASVGGKSPEEDFRSSIWYRMAEVLSDDCQERPNTVRVEATVFNGRPATRVCDRAGDEMLLHFSGPSARQRFLERCIRGPRKGAVPDRGVILDRLARMTRTQNERMMQEKGFKTRRQVMEESFWYRAAYDGYREFGQDGCAFHPAIEENSGIFTVTVKNSVGEDVCRMAIPRNRVGRILNLFENLLPNQHNLAIHPIPLKSIFKVSPKTKLDLEVRPMIELIQENGEARFFKRKDLERFRYGNLIYIKEMGLMAKYDSDGLEERKFRAPVKMVLKKSQIPSFFEAFDRDASDVARLVDDDLKPLRIIRSFDRVEIKQASLDRDWCWLSVDYGFGNQAISLAEILSAKREGRRYVGAPGGWIDCASPELKHLDPVLERFTNGTSSDRPDCVGLSKLDLFRFYVGERRPVDLSGHESDSDRFSKMIQLKPFENLPPLKGLTSALRPYQEQGVEWLHFLFENGFGGLLCDDMGLGKTHEVMAFMVGLQEYKQTAGPFLVVCPTTVLSHWDRKIREHAPSLRPIIYHGTERDLEMAVDTGNVLLTSYGILRRDIDQLEDIPFAAAVFDEIQTLKNPETQAYRAATRIKVPMKVGLTGTPIENRLMELKALLDLTLPGYLGSDQDFENGIVKSVELDPESPRADELSRVISPFTLRRRKETVLKDLPPKIEDFRTCQLSEDQVKFYRDAIESRAAGLLTTLRNEKETIPYIHIFALLNLLKQICNHPAMVNGLSKDDEPFQSGKWELFKELLRESLDSGQKVVVYSQFLNMLRLMEVFLKSENIDFVTLTGQSRSRGRIISRFNDDPDCRVYLGSLKAGGVGIDLVAASVVIHYDMWWNAAREDQATDRVHRVGQRRGVQGFKLITEGTLEEKIAAIIQKKRNLMDSIVKETDPNLLKAFSRDELIDLLAFP